MKKLYLLSRLYTCFTTVPGTCAKTHSSAECGGTCFHYKTPSVLHVWWGFGEWLFCQEKKRGNQKLNDEENRGMTQKSSDSVDLCHADCY